MLIGKLGPHYLQSRFKQFCSEHHPRNALEKETGECDQYVQRADIPVMGRKLPATPAVWPSMHVVIRHRDGYAHGADVPVGEEDASLGWWFQTNVSESRQRLADTLSSIVPGEQDWLVYAPKMPEIYYRLEYVTT